MFVTRKQVVDCISERERTKVTVYSKWDNRRSFVRIETM